MKQYIACSGDTWDSISYKVFDNEFLYTNLMDANRQFSDMVTFDGGEVITIPDEITVENMVIPTPWDTNKQIVTIINPPWGVL